MSFEKRENTNVVAGLRPLIEALKAGQQIDKILIQIGLKGELYQEAMNLLKEHHLLAQFVPVEKLNKLTRANHQGVVAFISPVIFYSLEEILEQAEQSSTSAHFLMLDGITDVRNFGAICRSAECFGAKNIIIPQQGSAAINEDSMKTSAGALIHLRICKVKNLVDASYLLEQHGYETVACTEKASQNLDELAVSPKWCLIMGSEEKGISTQLIKRSTHLVKIPMSGQTSSLNVSVAAGIALYALSKSEGTTSQA